MKKETMIAIAENLFNLSKLFAEVAGETDGSKAEEKAVPKADVKLEDIRAILAEKSQAGKTKDIRELLDSYGVGRLSDVSSDLYLKLLEDAKVL